jgi:hypothetical protein
MFDEPTPHEAAQAAFDNGAPRAVGLGEPLRIPTEELLEVVLDEPEQRPAAACRPGR